MCSRDTDTAAEDASLADQSEGITNNNEGGLEPGTGETEAETEAPTDADGNVIPQETTPQDEVVPFDDGLGLPDDMPADTSDGSDAGTAEAPEHGSRSGDGDCAGRSGRDDGDDAGCTVIPVKTGQLMPAA